MHATHTHSRRIAIFNAKGGTGKTTTTHSLACGLAARGHQVLVFDLDPQANLTYWFGATGAPSLYSVVQAQTTLASALYPTNAGVDLVPSEPSLIGAKAILQSRIGADNWLRQQLEHLPKHWDFILFDCPPGLDIFTIGALAAAEEVLAPVEPALLGLAGIAQLLDNIEDAQTSGLNPGLKLLGVLPVNVDSRRAITGEVIDDLANTLGDQLLTTRIRTNVRLVEAPGHHRSIFEYAPTSHGAIDYNALTDEVLDHGPQTPG